MVAYRAVAGIVRMIGLTPAQVPSRLTLVYLGGGYEIHDEDREYP